VRPIESARSERHGFAIEEAEDSFAVIDRTSGELVAYAKLNAAHRLARLLRVLEPSADQLARIVDDDRLLCTITVEYRGPCWRCGGSIESGSRARFNATTRLIRHLGRCPRFAGPARRPA
jgi:hypothetical protein